MPSVIQHTFHTLHIHAVCRIINSIRLRSAGHSRFLANPIWL
jgi:hypothetical protein